MSRLVRALAALFLAVAAMVLVGPSPALAAPFDCKEAPTPEVPGRGLTGFFQAEPENLPPDENPFAANAKTTIYEQYGYAGLRWTTYDLGCGPDMGRSPDAVMSTAFANWMLLFPKMGVAFTNAVVEVAFRPTFLGVFDPLMRDVSSALYRTVFTQLVPLALVAAGFLLIWRARRASFSSSAAAVGWAVFIMLVATALFRWPVEAGGFADKSVTATLSAVNGGLVRTSAESQTESEKTAAANTHESLLYNAWLAGTFGQATSDTARIYGPDLFDSTALTWREARILREDPDRGKQIIERKREKFAEVAEKVKEADPDAYEYLTGKRSDTRVGYAALSIFGAMAALPFLFGAALLVLASFLIVRFAVMLFPAFATLSLFPSMRPVVTSVANTVAAAVVNAVIFGIAAAVTLRGIGLLLNPESPLPPWLAMTLMLLVSIVMWFVTRPIRRLTTMVHTRETVASPTAGDATETVPSRGRRRAGRHRRGQGRVIEEEASERTDSVRSEAHSIHELEPSAALPGTFRFEPPEHPHIPTSPRGTAPAVTPTGGGLPAGRATVSSANRSGPLLPEDRSMNEVPREPREVPTHGSPRPVEPTVNAPMSPRTRKQVGSDGASAPLSTHVAPEAPGGGPIYIPRRPGNSNATGVSTEPSRERLEDFGGPIYQPKGAGRAPSRTDG
jgi:hypothetical protein